MSQFERDLRETLKRREPPAGFAGKVLARSREIEERKEQRSAWKWSWRWLTATATLVIVVGGILGYREHSRQLQAEKSKEELMFALRLTGTKLRLVQQKLSVIEQKTIELPLQQ